MEAAGFTPEDYAGDDVEVWPENWTAYCIFSRLTTQWNVGMAGRTGLRYEAVYPLLDRTAVCTEDWDDLFDDIRTMEIAALTAPTAT